MERSSVAKLILVVAVVGGLGYGAYSLSTKYMGNKMGKLGEVAGVEQTAEKKAGSGVAGIKAPDLTAVEVCQGITTKKPNGIVLSPVIFAKAQGGYDVAGDQPFGMTSNIRHETIVMNKETVESSKKAVSKFTVKHGAISISLPEMPQIVEGGIYYSHSNGILPLDLIVMWPQPVTKDVAKWLSAFSTAGLKEFMSEEMANDGKIAKTVKVMNSDDMSVRVEMMVEKDIVKKTESVSYTAVYITSPADTIVRKFLDETNTEIMKGVTSKSLNTGFLKWRQALALPEYRKADIKSVFNVSTVKFSDRTFPNTSTPIMQSSCELWNSIPIGYSWVMQKSEWDKIKSDITKAIVGKTLTDEELATGHESSDSIFLKVTKAAETGAGANIVRVDAIDKKTDGKISVAFDNFNMINVVGLRDGLK